MKTLHIPYLGTFDPVGNSPQISFLVHQVKIALCSLVGRAVPGIGISFSHASPASQVLTTWGPPNSMRSTGPNPVNRAQKEIMLHTFGVQLSLGLQISLDRSHSCNYFRPQGGHCYFYTCSWIGYELLGPLGYSGPSNPRKWY